MVPTILILGAGASIPYKFPSTESLRLSIINEALNLSNNTQELEEYKLFRQDVISFQQSFKKGVIYIDQFLENQPKYLKIGKILLAKPLLQYENPKNIFEIEIENDWYRFLIDTIIDSESRYKLQPLTILTFNYDRSLEFYFYSVLTSRYSFTEEQCKEQFSQIKIYHLYGSLGLLPWQSNENNSDKIIQYGTNLTPGTILRAINSLKIIYERDDNNIWEILPELYKYHHRIFFLGFGYNKINLKRLQLKEFDKMRFCCGTSMKIGKIEKRFIHTISDERLQPSNLINIDIINLFKNHFGLD